MTARNSQESVACLAVPASVVPNSRHGQNFLVDSVALDAEVNHAGVGPLDVVLEVGPGTGNLTRRLLAAGGKVVAVEIDEQFRPYLEKLTDENPNLRLVWGDATCGELPPFNKVVANLPYHLAMPLVFRFLECGFELGVVIVQKEFAQRVCARPGETGYGAFSVALQRLAQFSVAGTVGRTAFVPPPEVDSVLLRIVPESEPFPVANETLFRRTLDHLFLGRAKRVDVALKEITPDAVVGKLLGLLRREVRNRPVNQVAPREFGEITDALHKCGVALPAISGEVKRTAQRAGPAVPGGVVKPDALKMAEPQRRGRDVTIGLLVFRGIGDLTIQELGLSGVEHREMARLPLRGHDLLLVSMRRSLAPRLAGLRTVEDLFAVSVIEHPIQKAADLRSLGERWSVPVFLAGLALKNEVFGKPPLRKAHTCAVFVKADQDRQIHRKEIASALARVPESMRNWKMDDPAETEVWGFYSRESATVGVRLTSNDFRGRPELKREREGALRPTIAGAMVVACGPVSPAQVLDPMCGVGTVLHEYGVREPAAALIGFDLDPGAVKVAQANLRRGRERVVRVEEGDATRLGLADGCVDRLLCNLPFGKKYSSQQENLALYGGLSREFRRVLKPDGVMVLLTSDQASFRKTFGADPGLTCESVARVDVLGIWADMVRVRKR